MTAVSSPDPRPAMVELAALIYDRQLSDSAGGNMSVRSGDRIYVTPRFMGARYRWRIRADMISVLDAATLTVLEGPGDLSRESKAHLALYRAFAEAGAVIHAHPRYIQAFTSLGKPLEPATEYTEKYGVIPVVAPVKAHSQALADGVVEAMEGLREGFASHGLAVLLARHGIITMGRDLDEAYDTLERMEVNARCAIYGAVLRLAGVRP
ncbi:MAG: class II aldolase/adducin family protein [Anaerolineae bacterium]